MKTLNTKSLNELTNNRRNKFVVITRDETTFWKDEIAAKAGKIEGVYLVNLKEPTHLCELAISYPATFLRNYVHKFEAFTEDELIEMEHENGGDEVTYFQGSSVFNIVKTYQEGTEEENIEYEKCNPSYC